MSGPRLARALAVSAAVHLGLMGGLLALAHPRLPAVPPMRVALVGQAARAGEPGAPGAGPGPGLPGIAPAERAAVPPRPPPARSTPRAARTTEARAGDAEAAGGADEARAMVTAVQSDVWVLGAPREEPGAAPSRSPVPAASAARAGIEASRGQGGVAAGATSRQDGAGRAGAPSAAGSGSGTGEGSTGGDGSSASLLAALSQRLAWSAERCAPAAVVRTGHRAIPGVPLHFCLDAAGRPSEVGLLGTTGSDQLDRAARDCVVPGALPLPPAPGCYTVEVRFPIRG